MKTYRVLVSLEVEADNDTAAAHEAMAIGLTTAKLRHYWRSFRPPLAAVDDQPVRQLCAMV